MLKIRFSRSYRDDIEKYNVVENPPLAFDIRHTDDCITDPLSVEMIKAIDKSDVNGPNLIQSPVLGPIPPQTLSGGVKTLIMIKQTSKENTTLNATHCGDNCSPYLLKIAKDKDITINLRYLMHFDLDGDDEIFIVNYGSTVKTNKEFTYKGYKFFLGGIILKGKVHVKISNIANKITYEFTLNRNITIIEGNSATGKTVLISLIRAAKDKTLQGFIRVDCDYPCIAFSSDEYGWERRIKETENSVIFFDEDASYVKTEEFEKLFKTLLTITLSLIEKT